MKALLVVTDSEAVPVFQRALAEEHEGFRTRMWSFDVEAVD